MKKSHALIFVAEVLSIKYLLLRRKMFEEGKYLVRGGNEEQTMKRSKIFGEGKLMVTSKQILPPSHAS